MNKSISHRDKHTQQNTWGGGGGGGKWCKSWWEGYKGWLERVYTCSREKKGYDMIKSE